MKVGNETNGTAKINELIFVVMEGYEGGKTAIESNFGLVAFGDSMADLTADVSCKVQECFKAGFVGLVRIREFKDTVIKFT